MDRSVTMSCGCEAACGQQLRIVGATTSQCQTRPGVPLNAQFFLKKAVPSCLVEIVANEWVAEAFAFVRLACSPPGSSTDLLCLWPHHGCHRSL